MSTIVTGIAVNISNAVCAALTFINDIATSVSRAFGIHTVALAKQKRNSYRSSCKTKA